MTLHRLQVALLALVPGLCLSAAPAVAWNPPGHMIIALVAYDSMDAATRQQALALLHAHPRYADHFGRSMEWEMKGGSDAEKEQWLFAYAATWPDIVRSAGRNVTSEDVEKYSRPWWHFVDEPIFLSDAEEQKLAATVTFNRSRDLPVDADDPDMNVIQAIKNSSRIVGDKTAAAELRSVHLCWLLHLVGDAHQPLHSSALVTSRRYPGGDHGGNYLHYSHDFPLHAYWDSVISTEETYDTNRLLATELLLNAELATAGEQAAASLDPGTWIDEGCALAKKYVYTPEIMQKIAAREGHPHLGDLNPSPQYEGDAETVAERQAVLAGHRLAKLLTQLLE